MGVRPRWRRRRAAHGACFFAGMLLPLPRRFRPFVLDLTLTLWTVLELVYRAGLGDSSWLPARHGVRLEPQARATALVQLVGRTEVADVGLTRWVFPVWRFSSFGSSPEPPDALDLAMAIRTSGCVQPSKGHPGRFGAGLREHAAAVFLARHWTVDEMLDVWARCTTGPAGARSGFRADR